MIDELYRRINEQVSQIRKLSRTVDVLTETLARRDASLASLRQLHASGRVNVHVSDPDAPRGLSDAVELRLAHDTEVLHGEVTRAYVGEVSVQGNFLGIVQPRSGRPGFHLVARDPVLPGRQRLYVELVNLESYQPLHLRAGAPVARLVLVTAHHARTSLLKES